MNGIPTPLTPLEFAMMQALAEELGLLFGLRHVLSPSTFLM
jgi:hypothetical protein